ncbi:MAG TPA: hypothetical protein VHM31_09410 [Polyangia bacterium]|nr:hypothetical protein [Polyangia bacterium]
MIAGAARSLAWAGAAWFFLFGPAAAQAQRRPFQVALEYVAGPGCPAAAEFRAVVTGRLGYDPFAADAADRVLVQVVPRNGAIEGRLEWRDAAGAWTGDQTFPTTTTDCTRFARVVGFALAVQIQLLANVRAEPDGASAPPERAAAPPAGPSQVASERPPQQAPEPLVARPPAAAIAAAPTPSPPRRASGPELAAGAGPEVALGMSDGPILMARIFGALAWTHVSIELAAQASLPATTRRMDGAGFSQHHLLLGLAGCGFRAAWTACVLANGGEVRMSGVDIDRPTSAVAPVFQVGARLGASHHLGRRVIAGAHVDGLAALTRWQGTLDNLPVWTAPRFAAALGVDAVVRFP